MGWTGITTNDTIENVFFTEFSDANVLEYHKHGTSERRAEIYAAIYNPKRNITYGCVILFERNGSDVMFKEMDEFMHPYYYACPMFVLQKLSREDQLRDAGISKELIYNSKQWRDNCLAKGNKAWRGEQQKMFQPIQAVLF